ncbi:MAG: heparin lyase I family protein [Chloroflexota bacterium]
MMLRGPGWKRSRRLYLPLLGLAILFGVAALPPNPLSSISPAEAATSNILWSSGMEGGDLLEWSAGGGGGVFNSGTGMATASTDVAHSGSYSAKLSITGANGASQATRLHRWYESSNNPEAYYSGWYYFPRNYSPAAWWIVFQWKSKLSETDNDPTFTLGVDNRPNGEMNFYLYSKLNDRSFTQTAKNIPVGQWVHIEAYYKQAVDNTGRVTIWQDGVQILDATGVRTRRAGDNIRWGMTNYSDNLTPPDATIYVDDAAISTTRLGTGGSGQASTSPTQPAPTAPAPTALAPAAPAPSAGQERLVNGGFESGVANWYLPTWFSSVARVVSGNARSGSKALQFKGSSTGPFVRQDVPASSGQRVAFSGWVNVPQLSSGSTLVVELAARHRYNYTLKTFPMAAVSNTTGGWVQVGGSATMPAGTASVRLQLRFPRLNGVAYVDELSLQVSPGS